MIQDPGWWKLAFQVAIYLFAILLAVANLGSWHFGRLEEAARERERAKQREEERGRLTRIEAGVNDLVAQGRLSRQDANRLLQVVISEQMTLGEKLQVEIKRGQPEKKP